MIAYSKGIDAEEWFLPDENSTQEEMIRTTSKVPSNVSTSFLREFRIQLTLAAEHSNFR